MTHTLAKVTNEDDWRAYHAIRRVVLWEARGRYNYNDKYPDEFVPDNHPLLLKYNNQPIGTTRLDDRKDGTAIVRLVAITPEVQRGGHGRILGQKVEKYAHSLGTHTLLVNAAPDATGFYEKTGWTFFEWDKEELQGIAADCVQMRKDITR